MVKDLSLGPWCDQQVFQSGRGVMGNVFSLVLGVVPHVPPQQVRRALLGVSVTGSHTFDRGILDVQHSRFNTLLYLTTSQELGILIGRIFVVLSQGVALRNAISGIDSQFQLLLPCSSKALRMVGFMESCSGCV